MAKVIYGSCRRGCRVRGARPLPAAPCPLRGWLSPFRPRSPGESILASACPEPRHCAARPRVRGKSKHSCTFQLSLEGREQGGGRRAFSSSTCVQSAPWAPTGFKGGRGVGCLIKYLPRFGVGASNAPQMNVGSRSPGAVEKSWAE